MAPIKDKYGLDIPVPKPPKQGDGRDKEKIKTRLPRGYRATQKPGAYTRKGERVKQRKSRRKRSKVAIPAIYSDIYEEHKKKLLGLIGDFLGKELGVVVEWLRDMANVRRNIRKTLFSHSLMTAGLVILLFGVARYVECLCPTLLCGMSLMIVGLIAIIASLIYRRYY